MARNLTLTALLFMALAGCSTTSAPISGETISSGITEQTGYPGCPACSKVKTYTTPVVAKIASRIQDKLAAGWINARFKIQSTNQTPGNVPRYFLVTEFVNNGDFSNTGDVYIEIGEADVHLQPAGPRQGGQCFSNIGSGCSWTQSYELPAKFVEQAIGSQSGFKLFVAKTVRQLGATNDGYVQSPVVQNRLVGATAVISADELAGFVEGLRARGAEMPSSRQEADARLVQQVEQADRVNAAQQQLERQRPLKMKTGTRVCKVMSGWKYIGFVEDAANGKIKVRVADSVLLGVGVRQSDFHEQIIWDNPDAWALCEGN